MAKSSNFFSRVFCGTLFSIFYLFSAAVVANADSSFYNAHKNFFHLFFPNKSEGLLEYSYRPENDQDAGPGSFDLQTIEASFDLPIPQTEDSILLFSPRYQLAMYEFGDVPAARTNEPSLDVHSVELGLGMGQFFGDDVLLLARGSIGLYADVDNLFEPEALRPKASALLIYRINPGTQLLGGAMYSDTFDDVPLVPLLGIRIQDTSGRLHLSLTAPIEAVVSFAFTPQFSVYGGGWISGQQFRVEPGEGVSAFNMQVYDQRVGGGAIFWLGNHLKLGVEVGTTLGSELEFKTTAPGQFRTKELDSALYASARLGLAF